MATLIQNHLADGESDFPVLSPVLFTEFRIVCNIWNKGIKLLLHIWFMLLEIPVDFLDMIYVFSF